MNTSTTLNIRPLLPMLQMFYSRLSNGDYEMTATFLVPLEEGTSAAAPTRVTGPTDTLITVEVTSAAGSDLQSLDRAVFTESFIITETEFSSGKLVIEVTNAGTGEKVKSSMNYEDAEDIPPAS